MAAWIVGKLAGTWSVWALACPKISNPKSNKKSNPFIVVSLFPANLLKALLSLFKIGKKCRLLWL
jgi:hypothetical protein